MPTINRLVPKRIIEDRSLFSSATGPIYMIEHESEDGAYSHKHIFEDSPTTSNYNTGTNIGDEITDLSNGVKYRKTAATTWVTVTQS